MRLDDLQNTLQIPPEMQTVQNAQPLQPKQATQGPSAVGSAAAPAPSSRPAPSMPQDDVSISKRFLGGTQHSLHLRTEAFRLLDQKELLSRERSNYLSSALQKETDPTAIEATLSEIDQKISKLDDALAGFWPIGSGPDKAPPAAPSAPRSNMATILSDLEKISLQRIRSGNSAEQFVGTHALPLTAEQADRYSQFTHRAPVLSRVSTDF